jgi:ribose transport system ATP-binding protein
MEVAHGEIHALLGGNGSGKSTLIKCLSGFYRPDAGEIRVDGEQLQLGSAQSAHRLGCRFVHQDLGLIDDLSVCDNLYLGEGFPSVAGTVRSRRLAAAAREDLARVGLSDDLDPRELVGEIPAAAKSGVAIARALRPSHGRPIRLVVLDEPTATLPHDQVTELLAMVRAAAGSGVAVLYVTHRLEELVGFADACTVLRDGVRVATTSAAGLSHRDLVHLLVGSELDDVHLALQDLHPQSDATLEVIRVQAGVLRSASLTAHEGEILGIAGIAGSGREAVLPAIFGEIPRSGVVRVGNAELKPHRPRDALRARLAYLPADRKIHGGIMSLPAGENLMLPDAGKYWRRGRMQARLETEEVRSWFSQLDVRPADAWEQPLGEFSGGNQQKILFAKWLRFKPRVWLLDEPTQGVDIQAKAELHRQILKAAAGGMAVVVSSADNDELLALCHRIGVCRRGELVRTLATNSLTSAVLMREVLADAHTDGRLSGETAVA